VVSWFWFVLALIIGALAGALTVFLIGRKPKVDEDRVRELETQLDEYQREVSDHFVETASLVNNLTRSYKAVYDHLESGAYRLVGEEALQKRLKDVESKPILIEPLGTRGLPTPDPNSREALEAQVGTSWTSEEPVEEPRAEETQETGGAVAAPANPGTLAGTEAEHQAGGAGDEAASPGLQQPETEESVEPIEEPAAETAVSSGDNREQQDDASDDVYSAEERENRITR